MDQFKMPLGMEVGDIVLDGKFEPSYPNGKGHSSPRPFLAHVGHVCCGQMDAHLSQQLLNICANGRPKTLRVVEKFEVGL